MAAESDPRVGSPVGDFTLEGAWVRPSLNRIERDGRTIQLEPKIMEVLTFLAERAGEVVSKEHLLGRVWKGTFVSEDVLTRAVAELRRVFGDDPSTPRVIETIRKKGYRLLAPLQLHPRPGFDRSSAARRRITPGTILGVAGGAALLIAVALLVASRRTEGRGGVRILPLTNYPGDERDPAMSPDGTRVAFAWCGGEHGPSFNLYTRLVDAESLLRLTDGAWEDRSPAWSPDGQQVAFSRRDATGCSIFVVPSLGGKERRLAPCGNPEDARIAWSPDGKTIAQSVRESGGPARLELLNVATLERRPLTRPDEGTPGDANPAFSPDGKTVAFLRSMADDVDDVFTVPVAGGTVSRLTNDNQAVTGLDWSADGRSVVFSSSRAGLFSLWKVAARGGEPAWIAGGGSKMKHPSAARRGSRVAFENWIYEVNLWSMPAAAGSDPAGRRVTFSEDEWEFDPEFSPDGRKLAYVSTRSGHDEIWVVGRDGSRPVPITQFRGPRLGTPRWSPDGRRLLFIARPEGRAEVYRADIDGGRPVRLVADPAETAWPDFSRDGRFVVYGSRRSGAWQIWKTTSDGARPVAITRHGGYAPRVSPDGRSVYYTRLDVPGIWSVPLDGGEETLLLGDLARGSWNDWSVTPAGLFYARPGPNGDPIIRWRALSSGQSRDVANLKNRAWNGFTVSPDGTEIVYGRSDRRSSDIRMIDNAF